MTSQQFYDYIKQFNIEQQIAQQTGTDGSLDFIKDFDGDKSLNDWIDYTIATLQELNNDLNPNTDEEIIRNNNVACSVLVQFIDNPDRPFRVCRHCLQALISREPVKYVRIDSIYNEYMLCDWCSEFGHDELFEII